MVTHTDYILLWSFRDTYNKKYELIFQVLSMGYDDRPTQILLSCGHSETPMIRNMN